MWLFLEAIDVWLFRDGKPFNAGEAHIANSLFPPSSQTIQGALRTIILDTLQIDIKTYVNGQADDGIYKLIGNPGENENLLGKMQLYGPFVAKRYQDQEGNTTGYERYLPLPQDITTSKEADLRFRKTLLRTLKPSEPAEYMQIQDRKLRLLDVTSNDEALTDYWIAEREFANYLGGEALTRGDCVSGQELFTREYRSGNAINYEKRRVRSEDGMLYSASFIRPQADVGLLVWVSDAIADVLPNTGNFRLGGEGRSTRYRKLDSPPIGLDSPLNYGWKTDTRRLKVVFLTPTYFSDGWLPKTSQLNWFKEHLISAVFGRYMPIGGWDLRLNQPRPIWRYIPPSSVYYFEFPDDTRSECLQLLENLDSELPLDQLGYGHIAVGTW